MKSKDLLIPSEKAEDDNGDNIEDPLLDTGTVILWNTYMYLYTRNGLDNTSSNFALILTYGY